MYYIYKIENLINHKKYIGLTNNIVRRKSRHFTDLKYNHHDNGFLQKEYNIFGKDNFSFEIIFSGDVDYEIISDLEKYYIKKYDSYLNGYNQNEGGNFGPSNGGSHLIKSDILTILAVTEFQKRSGETLAKIFNTTRTTIGRIKKGVNHCEIYEEYHKMPLKERQELYNLVEKELDIESKIYNSNKLKAKRKLTKQQVFEVLVNDEFKIIPRTHMAKRIGVASTYTIDCICQNKTYKELNLEYQNWTDAQKQQVATLLREK